MYRQCELHIFLSLCFKPLKLLHPFIVLTCLQRYIRILVCIGGFVTLSLVLICLKINVLGFDSSVGSIMCCRVVLCNVRRSLGELIILVLQKCYGFSTLHSQLFVKWMILISISVLFLTSRYRHPLRVVLNLLRLTFCRTLYSCRLTYSSHWRVMSSLLRLRQHCST